MQEFGQQRRVAIQFGVFELNPQTRELRKHGLKLKVQDQPLQLLLMLLERPGEVVTREEIQKRLWSQNTHVEFDNAINSSVRKLRAALSDSADNPKFIETLARRGYRFIAPVSGQVAVRSVEPTNVGTKEPRTQFQKLLWLAVAAAVLLLLTVAILRREYLEARLKSEALPPPLPLTSYPGFQWSPSLSPDGTRVAFTWEEAGKRLPGIYVKLIGPGAPVRIDYGEERDFGPAWSPDGRWIAFLREEDPFHSVVMLAPSLGGTAREVARVQLDLGLFFVEWRAVSPPFLAWSSDSRWLLALEQPGIAALAPVKRLRVVRIAVESGEKTPVELRLDSDKNGD